MRLRQFNSVSRDHLVRLVKKVFPQAILQSLTEVRQGCSATVYKGSILNPDQTFCLRLDSSSEIKKLVRAYQLLKGIVPVPDIYAEGKMYLFTSWVAGVNAALILKSLTPEQRCHIAFSSGEILARMHSVRMKAFGFLLDGEKGYASAREFLEREVKDTLKVMQRFCDAPFLLRLRAFVDRNCTMFEGSPVLVMGDYRLENMNVVKNDSWQVSGLYDFGQSYMGLPEWDFAVYFRNVCQRDPEMKSLFLAGYKRSGFVRGGVDERVRVFDVFLSVFSLGDSLRARVPVVKKVERISESVGLIKQRLSLI